MMKLVYIWVERFCYICTEKEKKKLTSHDMIWSDTLVNRRCAVTFPSFQICQFCEWKNPLVETLRRETRARVGQPHPDWMVIDIRLDDSKGFTLYSGHDHHQWLLSPGDHRLDNPLLSALC